MLLIFVHHCLYLKTSQTLPAKEYGVKDVVEGIEYEFRVSAINFSGAGEASTPSEFVFARDPKSKAQSTLSNRKLGSLTYNHVQLYCY